jgi:hypothetical protein
MSKVIASRTLSGIAAADESSDEAKLRHLADSFDTVCPFETSSEGSGVEADEVYFDEEMNTE